LMMRRRNDPCRPARVGVGRQLPSIDEPLEGVRGHVGPVPWPDPEVLNHGWGGSGERVRWWGEQVGVSSKGVRRKKAGVMRAAG
jgi:hypothetical protein